MRLCWFWWRWAAHESARGDSFLKKTFFLWEMLFFISFSIRCYLKQEKDTIRSVSEAKRKFNEFFNVRNIIKSYGWWTFEWWWTFQFSIRKYNWLLPMNTGKMRLINFVAYPLKVISIDFMSLSLKFYSVEIFRFYCFELWNFVLSSWQPIPNLWQYFRHFLTNKVLKANDSAYFRCDEM